MVLDITIDSLTCAIIQQNVVLLPVECANVPSLLTQKRTQVNTLRDPSPSTPGSQPRELSKSLILIKGLLVEKNVTYFGNHLICVFSYICQDCGHSICLQCSQIAAKGAPSELIKPLTDH